MNSTLIWAVILLVVGLVLLLIEVFVPSGGLLGVMSGASLIASIALAFSQGMGTGLGFLIFVLISGPTIFGLGMHYWPETALGRRLVLTPPKPEEVDPTTERERALGNLVGQIGRTLTPLLPSGITEINGRRVDTMAEGMSINAGSRVRVIGVSGHRVIVRKLETQPEDA